MQSPPSQRGYLYERFRLFHTVDQDEVQIDWHFHAFDKIVFFRSGHTEYMVESESVSLRPGDLLLIAYGQLHRMHAYADAPYERFILYLDSGYLASLAPDAGGLNACFARARATGHSLLRLNDVDRAAVYTLFTRLEKAMNDDSPYAATLAEALLTELMVFLCRAPEEASNVLPEAGTDQKIAHTLQYINDNLNGDLSCATLAARIFMSRSSFQHRFKAVTGYSPHAYVRLKRLVYASELLAQDTPVLETGRLCGYNDYSAFCHAFTQQFGVTPSAYRPRGSMGETQE
ncbi:MAG: helix-turn-helix transcriptional regulator [Clostridia bacterium]|nr:helix-turn-helix transcriptional regulator [Clostridia bacterium]